MSRKDSGNRLRLAVSRQMAGFPLLQKAGQVVFAVGVPAQQVHGRRAKSLTAKQVSQDSALQIRDVLKLFGRAGAEEYLFRIAAVQRADGPGVAADAVGIVPAGKDYPGLMFLPVEQHFLDRLPL